MTSTSFSAFKNMSWPDYKQFHPSNLRTHTMPISSTEQSFNQLINTSITSTHTHTHRSIKLKQIYGKRRRGNGQALGVDSTCKYAKNNQKTKTSQWHRLDNGKAPNEREVASYKMSQRGPKKDGLFQLKQKSLVNLQHVVISYPNICTTFEVQTWSWNAVTYCQI